MSHEVIYLGPGPADERLAQTVEPDFERRNKAECLAYAQAIRRVCGDPPPGATLRIQENQHGVFGVVYREVVVEYDPRNQAAADYACMCEDLAPATWAAAGMQPPTCGLRKTR